MPDRVKAALFDLEADPGETTNLLEAESVGSLAGLQEDLDARLRTFVEGQHGEAEKVDLDPETIQELESLGYIN